MPMQCYLCGGVEFLKRPGSVRDNPHLEILECCQCSLVFLSSLNHVDEADYRQFGMHEGVPPSVEQRLSEANRDDQRRYEFIETRVAGKTLLDFGCGAGGFLEKIKANCSRAAGVEVEEVLHESFSERDLQVARSLGEAESFCAKWDYITAFHVVEHLNDPGTVLQKLAEMLAPDGSLIIEVPSSEDILLTTYGCSDFQAFTYWSKHLFLFNTKTLKILASKAGLSVDWIEGVQRYPLSNHLYWLAKGKPGGHDHWEFLNRADLETAYSEVLSKIGGTDTLIACFRKGMID